MSINAKVAELSYFLRDNLCYLVPNYQRRYAWRAERNSNPLQDLWEDVRVTLQRRRDGEDYMHFFGPLVVISSDEANLFYLVDGQQRLTTMILLVRAIRQSAEECARHPAAQGVGFHELKDTADRFLLNGSAGLPNDRRLKLIPAREDYEDLLEVLGLMVRPPGDGLIQQAFRLLKRLVHDEYVAGWLPQEQVRNLTGLLDVVIGRFQMVQIEIDGDEYAYEIFHSLNTKGTPLAESDKIKNYCFMKMRPLGPTELDRVYREVWTKMVHDCCSGIKDANEAETLDQFMHVFLWLVRPGQLGQRQDYGEFKRLFVSRLPVGTGDGPVRANEPAVALSLLTELQTEYAMAFAIVRNPVDLLTRPQEIPLRDSLERLRHLGCGEDSEYLLLELVRNYLEFNRPVPAALRSMHFLTSYFIWRRLCGLSAKPHNRIFSTVARNLRNDRLAGDLNNMDQFADALGRQLVGLPVDSDDRWPDVRRDLLQRTIHGNLYSAKSAGFVKHILWYLERGTMDGKPDGSLAVEHIFPQTPSNEWDVSLNPNDKHWMQDRAHSLSNLALLEANEPPLQNRAGNRPYLQKREVYSESKIQMTCDLYAYETWGPQQLEERGNDLVRRIINIWPRPAVV